jgi:hypothetical protein
MGRGGGGGLADPESESPSEAWDRAGVVRSDMVHVASGERIMPDKPCRLSEQVTSGE